jgi:glutamyl-tRNA synthetase
MAKKGSGKKEAGSAGKKFEGRILAYALENAILHDGKAQPNAVLGKLFLEGLKKEQVREVMPEIIRIVSQVNKKGKDEQASQFELLSDLVKKREHEERKGLPELENAGKGKVVLRIAPFPSGPLHIGNARQAVINDEYAKRYNGRMILVFDDTIGSEEKPIIKDAYKLIFEGLRWLGVKIDDTFYKSDRLQIYYEHALQLIRKGKAYVCRCSAEELRKNREKGAECKCRKNSTEKNIKEWQQMLEKGNEGEATLRIKTSMKHPDPAFRDRVLFRISGRSHPRIGKRYKVWPLLDFSMAIDDHLLSITHIIRGKELMMEGKVEKLIWDAFGWKHPFIIYTGLLQLEGVKLSKSKSAKEVESGEYTGWDDPRTWSLQSLAKRGIKPEALREFIIQFGLNQNEVTVPVDMLYSENHKIVESADRYFFIEEPKVIKIKKAPEIKAEIPLHPEDLKRGSRKLHTKGEFLISKHDFKILNEDKGNYRLMHLLNFESKNLAFISQDIDEKLNAKLLHWLPNDEQQITKTKVLLPTGDSVQGMAEKAVESLKPGTVIQFERFGFCCFQGLMKDKKSKEEIAEFWFTHK